jgi:hypothetical protein
LLPLLKSTMPPQHNSNDITGFLDVAMQPSGCFAADISKDGVWWWLGPSIASTK